MGKKNKQKSSEGQGKEGQQGARQEPAQGAGQRPPQAAEQPPQQGQQRPQQNPPQGNQQRGPQQQQQAQGSQQRPKQEQKPKQGQQQQQGPRPGQQQQQGPQKHPQQGQAPQGQQQQQGPRPGQQQQQGPQKHPQQGQAPQGQQQQQGPRPGQQQQQGPQKHPQQGQAPQGQQQQQGPRPGQQQQQGPQKHPQQGQAPQGQQQQQGPRPGQQQQQGPQKHPQQGQAPQGQQQQQGPRPGQQQQQGPQKHPQQGQAPQGQQQQQGPRPGQQQQQGPQKHPQQGQAPQGQQQQQGPRPGQQQQQGPQKHPQQGQAPQGQQQQQGPRPGQQQQQGPQKHPQQGQAPQGQQQQQGPRPGQQQQQGPQKHPQQGQAPQGQQQQQGPRPGQQQQQGPQKHPQQGQAPQGQQQQQGPRPGQQQQQGPQKHLQQGQAPQGQQQQQGPRPGQQQQQGPQKHQQGQAPQGQQQQQGSPPGQQQQQGPQKHPQQQAWGQQSQKSPQGQRQQGPQSQQQGWAQIPVQRPQERPQGGQQQQAWGQGQQRPQGQQQGWAQGQQRPQSQQHQRPQEQQRSQPQQRSHEPSPSSSTASFSSGSTTSKSGIVRGSIGREQIVEANYLRLNLDKMPSVAYHYDVVITPDRPKKFFRAAFQQLNRQFFQNTGIAFDGVKSCYTVKNLNIGNESVNEVIVDDGKGRTLTYKITLKETDTMEIDLTKLRTYFKERIFDKPMRALQCLEVVLANPCHNKGVRAGRSFFTKPPSLIDLKDGYELWIGLYQAMILGDEPFLNVDISHKSFPREITLLNLLQQQQQRNYDPSRTVDRRDLDKLKDFLRGLRIIYQLPGTLPKEYTYLDVSAESASKQTFMKDDGQKMTIAEYFAKERNIKLQYPDLNCILVGSSVKSIALPMEFCRIGAGQAIRKKDGSRQVQEIIRYAATSTNERKNKIMNLIQKFEHNNDNLIIQFGIQISPNFIDVPIRVLNAPLIEYYNKEIQRVNKGSWRMNQNTKFLVTKPKPHKWAVIYSKDSRSINFNKLEQGLVKFLKDAARGANVDLEPKPLIDAFADIDSKLSELKRNNYDLVIVAIPFFRTTYEKIKQTAELKYGILTQCIKEETIERRCNMQLATNLMLKINSKLNGTNHKIAANTHVPLQNVMFMGADVTHPSPDQKNIPSVVGVAASHDPNGASYNMQYRLQKSTLEEIEDMRSIVKQHLRVYFNKMGKYPEHIIYYRDGVSDGQFEKVRKLEIQSMKAGCAELRINPKVTCIIAVKRHHTRLFPKNISQFDKFNNVEPGTVLDRVIVHPNEVQFFMVSHQSIQGTAKPTRYNVILDEQNMDINTLQLLTHNLCHLFPRCNRSVSYPTPVYLAHLVAARGRVYIDGTQRFGRLQDEYDRRKIHNDIMEKNPMYFV